MVAFAGSGLVVNDLLSVGVFEDDSFLLNAWRLSTSRDSMQQRSLVNDGDVEQDRLSETRPWEL
jgi:hypothetical protein